MQTREFITIIVALCGIICYFLKREFTRKDAMADDIHEFKELFTENLRDLSKKFSDEMRVISERNSTAINALNTTVSGIAVSMVEQRANLMGTFATNADLKDLEERVWREVDKHNNDCPVRNHLK